MDTWPCFILQDDEGNHPSESELVQIANALNRFHDDYSIHQTDAQKFLLLGNMVLEQLAANNQFEKFIKQRSGKGGTKEVIDWNSIIKQMVSCNT